MKPEFKPRKDHVATQIKNALRAARVLAVDFEKDLHEIDLERMKTVINSLHHCTEVMEVIGYE